MPDKEKNWLHLYCAVAPVLIYFGISFVAVAAAQKFGWDNGILNTVNSVVNLLVMYFYFYRRYELLFGAEGMPALLPGRQATVRKKSVKILPADYIWVLMAGASIALAVNNCFSILKLGEKIGTYQEVAQDIYSGSLLGIAFRTIILAALLEEFMMRGLFYRSFSQLTGRAAAMIVSSLVFGIIHGNLLQGMYAFVLGMLFSYIYDCFGRKMTAPVIAHIAANTVSVLGSKIPAVAVFFVNNMVVLTIVSVCWCILSVFMIRRTAALRTAVIKR